MNHSSRKKNVCVKNTIHSCENIISHNFKITKVETSKDYENNFPGVKNIWMNNFALSISILDKEKVYM